MVPSWQPGKPPDSQEHHHGEGSLVPGMFGHRPGSPQLPGTGPGASRTPGRQRLVASQAGEDSGHLGGLRGAVPTGAFVKRLDDLEMDGFVVLNFFGSKSNCHDCYDDCKLWYFDEALLLFIIIINMTIISTIVVVTIITTSIVIVIISTQRCHFFDPPAASQRDCSSIDKRRD